MSAKNKTKSIAKVLASLALIATLTPLTVLADTGVAPLDFLVQVLSITFLGIPWLTLSLILLILSLVAFAVVRYSGYDYGVWAVLGNPLVVVLCFSLFIFGTRMYGKPAAIENFFQQPNPTPSNKYDVVAQQKILINNKLTGQGIGGASVTLYTADLLGGTALTADSNGYITTPTSYESGTHLWLKITSGSTVAWADYVCPQSSNPQADLVTGQVDVYVLGTVAVNAALSNGTAIANGASYNVSTNPKKQTFTFTIVTTTDNTGFVKFYDPLQKIYRTGIFDVRISGVNSGTIIVPDQPKIYSQTDNNLYGVAVDELYRWIDAGTGLPRVVNGVKKDGITTFSISIDATALPKGSTATLKFEVYAYDDIQYLSQYNSHRPDAVSLASYTIYIKA